jgi:hypothetical protein
MVQEIRPRHIQVCRFQDRKVRIFVRFVKHVIDVRAELGFEVVADPRAEKLNADLDIIV